MHIEPHRSRISKIKKMCTIQETIDVVFPEYAPVRIKHWVEVDGNKFIKIVKSDGSVVRLLTGHSVGASRALARTDIVEALISLRNTRVDELVKASLPESNLAARDLGVGPEHPRHTAKRMRRYAGQLPEVIEIEAPACKDVSSVKMNVLRQRPDQPLWVELVPENLDYLRAYVCAQIEAGDVKQPAPGENRAEGVPSSPAPGVVFARDRNAYRTRFKDEDGSRHTKDFKQQSLAVAFARGGASALLAGEAAMPLQNGDHDKDSVGGF